jgi:hypothetical protein
MEPLGMAIPAAVAPSGSEPSSPQVAAPPRLARWPPGGGGHPGSACSPWQRALSSPEAVAPPRLTRWPPGGGASHSTGGGAPNHGVTSSAAAWLAPAYPPRDAPVGYVHRRQRDFPFPAAASLSDGAACTRARWPLPGDLYPTKTLVMLIMANGSPPHFFKMSPITYSNSLG